MHYRKIIVFFVGILVTLMCLFFTWENFAKNLGILTKINHIFYDTNLKLFHKSKVADNVVIVDIDEKSLQKEGRWPWPRSKMAALTKNLQNNNAAVIVFDILFPESEPNIANVLLSHAEQGQDISSDIRNYLSQQSLYFDNDKMFADVLTKSDIVLGVFFNKDLYQKVGKLGKPGIAIE